MQHRLVYLQQQVGPFHLKFAHEGACRIHYFLLHYQVSFQIGSVLFLIQQVVLQDSAPVLQFLHVSVLSTDANRHFLVVGSPIVPVGSAIVGVLSGFGDVHV